MAEYLEDLLQQSQTQPTAQPTQQTVQAKPSGKQYLEDLIGEDTQAKQITPLKNTFGGEGIEGNPLTPVQSFISAMPRTPQGKAEAIRRMEIPGVKDIGIDEDGKTVLINGQPFEDINNPVELIKGLSRFAGHNMALGGQVVAEAALSTVAPEAGIPLMIATLGAGAAGGEVIQQLGARAASGEKLSAPDIAAQVAMGGSVPVAGKGIALAGRGLGQVLRGFTKPTEAMISKLGDAFPEVAETLLGIDRGAAQEVVNAAKSGRNLEEFFNVKNADTSIPTNLAKKVFYGGEQAEESFGNWIKTFQSHLANAQSPRDRELIYNVYQDMHKGLSRTTLETIANTPSDIILSPEFSGQDAYRVQAQNMLPQIEKVNQAIKSKYNELIGSIYKGGAKATVSIADDCKQLLERITTSRLVSGDPTHVGGLIGKDEEKLVNEILDKFKPGEGNDKTTKLLKSMLGKNATATVDGVKLTAADLMDKEGNFLKEIPVNKAHYLTDQLDGTLDKLFKIEGKSSPAVAEFIKNVRAKISTKIPGMAEMNQEYGALKGLKAMLGGLKAGNLQSEESFSNFIKNSYANGTRASYLGDFDRLTGTKLTQLVDKLGAAQELQAFGARGLESARQGFISDLKGVTDIKNAKLFEQNQRLSALDNSIKTKFIQQAKDHSAVSAFVNAKQSLFKSRVLGWMLAGSLGLHVPLPVTFAAGYAASNPRNVMKMLIGGQKIMQSGGVAHLAEEAGKKATTKAGHAILGKLIRGH